MRESASTDLREPQGSNPLGPPGPNSCPRNSSARHGAVEVRTDALTVGERPRTNWSGWKSRPARRAGISTAGCWPSSSARAITCWSTRRSSDTVWARLHEVSVRPEQDGGVPGSGTRGAGAQQGTVGTEQAISWGLNNVRLDYLRPAIPLV